MATKFEKAHRKAEERLRDAELTHRIVAHDEDGNIIWVSSPMPGDKANKLGDKLLATKPKTLDRKKVDLSLCGIEMNLREYEEDMKKGRVAR